MIFFLVDVRNISVDPFQRASNYDRDSCHCPCFSKCYSKHLGYKGIGFDNCGLHPKFLLSFLSAVATLQNC